ncbi:aldehyde dehydrogenase family protein [Salinisphaera sp. Q1T1-3]|uniref:aldehyde dehydrogenase family protein n=1 Tax=Salinisphaera sp. Q1T1-3 TaxID=2321229 RepID=UPI000E739946|nr:aldehyde dehydrogenase family protein [Salinisphaera sp. Q1T1-3]RJS93546.1 aldehyde dehydrogenase family protein [Salinisphaera sp. Q1T1-3]
MTETDSAPAAAPHAPAEKSAADIQRLFKAQQPRALALRESTAAERIDKLRRLRRLMFDRREAIMDACHADFGKPRAEVEVTEILPVVAEARHACARLKSWMKPQRKRPTLLLLGTQAAIHTEPRGRCLIISPWNYPINLSFGPLVSAIAAGNTVILKPSELTPHCARLMAEMIAELFDPSEVTVVQGAVATAQSLLDLPFDHIFFTGSPAVGRVVMAAAAKHLSSVTLELGGKSPVVVDASADLDNTARTLVWAKFANNGQTCIAPDYVYVHEDIRDAFLKACVSALEALYGDQGRMADNQDYCRIVNDKHHARLRGILEDAHERGARLTTGAIPDNTDRYIAPTIVTDIPADARIMEEEIFGPLMPVLGFNDLSTAIADINARPKPLALYIYAKDKAVIDRILASTSAGGTAINTAMLQFLHKRLPFGGVNNSGIGNSHGHAGYRAFSHERSVLRDRFSLAFLFRPPYNAFTRQFIRFTVRWLG